MRAMLGLERSRAWTSAQSHRALSTLVRSRIQRVQESFFKPVSCSGHVASQHEAHSLA